MSSFQEVFKRIEVKYILDEPTYRLLRKKLDGYAVVDKYGKSTICNIYYDTPSHQLIRSSLEKPCYKEKLRIRSYGTPDDKSTVFVELKKKYDGVVYKRRVDMSLEQSREFVESDNRPDRNPQIENELAYCLKYYKGLAPAMYLSYDRIAMYGIEDNGVRITFDSHIIYREEELELEKGVWGKELLDGGTRIMEIKIAGAMPLWLSHILDELKIYPASFSKYGTAYLRELTEKKENNKKITGKVINCA